MWKKPQNEMEEPFDEDSYVPEGTDYHGQTSAALSTMGMGAIALAVLWQIVQLLV